MSDIDSWLDSLSSYSRLRHGKFPKPFSSKFYPRFMVLKYESYPAFFSGHSCNRPVCVGLVDPGSRRCAGAPTATPVGLTRKISTACRQTSRIPLKL